MSQANVELVKRGLDAWNRDDFGSWVENMHPDVEWIPGIPQRVEGAVVIYRGISGLRRFRKEWRALWDFRLDAAELRDPGDAVLVLGGMSATGRASGVDIEAPLAMLVTLEDGLVTQMRSYPSADEALAAVRRAG